MLIDVIDRPSWADVIAAGAIDGLAALRDDRALPHLYARTRYGHPSRVRRAAALAIPKLSTDRERASTSRSSSTTPIRSSASTSSARSSDLGDARSRGALRARAEVDLDPRVRRRIREVVRDLGGERKQTDQLKEDVEKLQSEQLDMKLSSESPRSALEGIRERRNSAGEPSEEGARSRAEAEVEGRPKVSRSAADGPRTRGELRLTSITWISVDPSDGSGRARTRPQTAEIEPRRSDLTLESWPGACSWKVSWDVLQSRPLRLEARAPTAPRALATPAALERPISAVTVAPARRVPRLPSAADASGPVAVAAAPNPRPAAGECKTVREILPPWEVLQEKLNKKAVPVPARNEVLNQDAQQALAAQEAANALWSPPASKTSSPSYAPSGSIETPPPSGVRMSESGPAAPSAAAAGCPTLSRSRSTRWPTSSAAATLRSRCARRA